MQPHQERVVQEAQELQEKTAKLSAFVDGALFVTLHESERTLMARQLDVMYEYLTILHLRISLF